MQLMWFRNDLRALDNLALQESLSRDNATCALYIHCNIQMDKHDVGQNRQFFHLQQVKCLFQELQAVRIPCIYVEIDNFSDVPTFLRDFTQQ